MDDLDSVMPYRHLSYEELKAARARAGLEPIKLPTYRCNKCKDTGWVTIKRENLQPDSVPCECMAQKRLEQSLHNSGINPDLLTRCTFDTFQTPTESTKRMKDTAMAFLQDHDAKGIGFFGRSGTGKTHLSIAICVELAKRGRTVKYMAYNAMMRKLMANKFDEEGYERHLEPLSHCGVLYIDDLFKNASDYRFGHLSQEEKRIMFELLDRRYQNNAITIISTEMPLNELQKEDEALASRIYALVGKYGVKCDGQNWRFTEHHG